MKVIIDCNVLIAAGISNGTCRKVVEAVVQDHTWYVSEPILEEFLDVIRRPHLNKYPHRFEKLYRTLLQVSICIQPDSTPIELPDPDDEVYLRTAVAANADALITGNQRDFPFPDYRGIRILSPREFLSEYT